MSGIDVFCWGCASHGAVTKVTAGLRCSCGSDDVDLYTASHEQLARVAAVRTVTELSFAAFMTKASAPVGGDVPGWNEYAGPRPTPSTMSNGVAEPITCPVCHGSRYDTLDKGTCRECGGSGVVTPTTSAQDAPAVARHQYPSTQTTVPFMGRRKQSGRTSGDPLGSAEQHIKDTTKGYGGEEDEPKHWTNSKNFGDWEPRPYEHTGQPLALHGAQCPNCGKSHTELVQDRNENAWWSCPYCGPLSNVDSKPHVDPFNPPEDFVPNGKLFKSSSKLWRGKKTGRLMKQIVLIGQTNPGLTIRETVGLARTALNRYPEAR